MKWSHKSSEQRQILSYYPFGIDILNSIVKPEHKCGNKVLASATYRSYPAASSETWTGSLAESLLAKCFTGNF